MPLTHRPELTDLEPCPHGGPQFEELRQRGLTPEGVLDFSVSTNPFGPPPGVRQAVNTAPIELYPDSGSTELRQALATRLGVGVENLLVGNGATELIRLIALAYFSPGDTVLIPQPTFGEYEVACRIAGARLVKPWAKAEEGFALKVDEINELIRRHRPRAVFLGSPNNPTGHYLSQEQVARVLGAAGDGLVVVDEAFVSFAEGAWDSPSLTSQGNLLLLRSLTKDYALAGLRLGYAVAAGGIIAALGKVCPPWNVNIAAQRAGLAVLKEGEYLTACLKKLKEAREFLISGLLRLGLTPLPSSAHFFLVKVGEAARFRAALLSYGILVRDCTSFGLPQYVRLAPRSRPQCQRLLEAIADMKNRGGWGV